MELLHMTSQTNQKAKLARTQIATRLTILCAVKNCRYKEWPVIYMEVKEVSNINIKRNS